MHQTGDPTDWRTKVPTVSELTRRIRGHIENSFFDIWVRGEVSNFRKPASGHGYFVLKDASAQLRGVMFRGQLSKIKFQLNDGIEILAHGKVSVYEARGEYQILCDTLEPVGVGALQLAFEQLKQKLQKEGLFDPKRKKPLPFLPKRIGVITSSTGAAIRDILKVTARRFPNREIFVLPTAVQGGKAAAEIVKAFEQVQSWNTLHPKRSIEALIVGRGGGSLEDLWPFNEEIVARAIDQCPIPVISSVGHEIDFTISDFVADVRAPTPSAAAEIVFPKKDELIAQVDNLYARLKMSVKKQLEQLRIHLDHMAQRLVDPRQKIQMLKDQFTALLTQLTSTMRTQCLFFRKRLEHAAERLHLLSPLQVIGRGYSITSDAKGTIIRSIKDVKTKKKLLTRVSDGIIYSESLSSSEKTL